MSENSVAYQIEHRFNRLHGFSDLDSFEFKHVLMNRFIKMSFAFSIICFFVGCTVDSSSNDNSVTPFSNGCGFSILIFNQEQRLELWELKTNQPHQLLASFPLPNFIQLPIGLFQFNKNNQIQQVSPNALQSSKTTYFRTIAYPEFPNNSTALSALISKKIKPELKQQIFKQPFKIWVFPNDKRIDTHFKKELRRTAKDVELLVFLESVLAKYNNPE